MSLWHQNQECKGTHYGVQELQRCKTFCFCQ